MVENRRASARVRDKISEPSDIYGSSRYRAGTLSILRSVEYFSCVNAPQELKNKII